jgi:hypothetical protein
LLLGPVILLNTLLSDTLSVLPLMSETKLIIHTEVQEKL